MIFGNGYFNGFKNVADRLQLNYSEHHNYFYMYQLKLYTLSQILSTIRCTVNKYINNKLYDTPFNMFIELKSKIPSFMKIKW